MLSPTHYPENNCEIPNNCVTHLPYTSYQIRTKHSDLIRLLKIRSCIDKPQDLLWFPHPFRRSVFCSAIITRGPHMYDSTTPESPHNSPLKYTIFAIFSAHIAGVTEATAHDFGHHPHKKIDKNARFRSRCRDNVEGTTAYCCRISSSI